jgi:trans-2-enoyl-CoA reductase
VHIPRDVHCRCTNRSSIFAAVNLLEVRNRLWPKVDTQNIGNLSDIEGFREEFLHLHGFGMKDVDYERDVDV